MTQAPPTGKAVSPSASGRKLRPLLFAWAIGGVLVLLSQALYRLTPIAWEVIVSPTLTPAQTWSLVGWVILNLYLEGYRGFQLRFVPRVVSRAHYLATRPAAPAILLAPLFAMAYYGATRSARRAAFIVTGMVVVAIVIVRALPQPYRGIIDAGVVAGLSWGVVALGISSVRCAVSGKAPGDPEIEPNSPPPTSTTFMAAS